MRRLRCGRSRWPDSRNAVKPRAGWTEAQAAAHFDECAARYELGDPVAFVAAEARRIRGLYPGLLVAPFLYRVEDDRLAQIAED